MYENSLGVKSIGGSAHCKTPIESKLSKDRPDLSRFREREKHNMLKPEAPRTRKAVKQKDKKAAERRG